MAAMSLAPTHPVRIFTGLGQVAWSGPHCLCRAQQDEVVHSVSPGWQWTEQLRSLPRRAVCWRRELRSTQASGIAGPYR